MPQSPPVQLDSTPASTSPSGNSPNFSSPVLPNFQHSTQCTCSHAPLFSSVYESPPIHFQSQMSSNQSDSLPEPIDNQSTYDTSHTYSMKTRSMNNIYKPKQFHLVIKHPTPPTIEPTCVSQAIRDPK